MIYLRNMKLKKVSETTIVRKVTKGVKENVAVESEKMNKTDKPLSPGLLLQMIPLPPLTFLVARWRADCSATKGSL